LFATFNGIDAVWPLTVLSLDPASRNSFYLFKVLANDHRIYMMKAKAIIPSHPGEPSGRAAPIS
jgi:hypothetical protein